jgi:hypothetical protein
LKKEAKNFYQKSLNEQKFFGSFFQKRTFLLTLKARGDAPGP